MKPERLRVRILDALEDGPATVFDLSNMVRAHINNVRCTCKVLELEQMIECVDALPSNGDRGVGRSWKVFAIKGAA